ncbi:ATP-binding protein [Actinoplanes sp. NPDC023801]|uniref:ATP-binding protein n=1 Tax=Actinoplanes sp. NPDC023801 TaxID=3154595 RepID=UPI00340D1794
MLSAPDVACADSVAGFVACLRELKLHAGNPSFEELRRRCGVPSSTLADALQPGRDRPPRLDVVQRFVAACGVAPDGWPAWEAAWRAVSVPVAARPASVPHQLPGWPDRLAGRHGELRQLDDLRRLARRRARRGMLALLVGPAGVGKTALALNWAHARSGDHPDGQLYLDLLGSAARPPVAPTDALRQLLVALGTRPGEVPESLSARAALYRSQTYRRRLLVVLDNARDAQQVRLLLPGGPGCTTLVTSRNRLSALVAVEGGTRLSLAPLPADDAAALVAMVLAPGRADAEPDAVRELVRLCGALPLALRIASANLADRPQWSIAGYVGRLAAGNRLAQLALAGDEATAVASAFRLSYAALSGPARRVFRGLATMPQPDFTVEDLVAATGRPVAETERQVEVLAAAHLVEPIGPGRYTVHDLLRLYAASLSRAAPRRVA